MPEAILANRQLEWRELDVRTVEVSADVAGERIAVRLLFDGDKIVGTSAERPRLEAGGAVTGWVGRYRDYAAFNGIRLPGHGEVRWELPEGPFTYWRGTVTSMELVE